MIPAPIAPALRPRYRKDEVLLGVVATLVVHGLCVAPMVASKLGLTHPSDAEDEPLVARPVVQATLLKLGKPIDKSKLPDRIVPKARTAPQKEKVASQEDPAKKDPDAGPPPPNADDGPQNLQAKNDPFAEDAGRARPEEGHESGIDGGTETDPSKVRAGDMYAAQLAGFFRERWTYPISQGEAQKLCVVFQLNINPQMKIWHVRAEPVKKSGNELFDDSARSMLQKLLEDHTPLPEPPGEVAELFKNRRVNVALSGDLHGDSSRCK